MPWPRQPLPVPAPLWEVGAARPVAREALHASLGAPHYVETDSTRTFGGDEDMWAFQLPGIGIAAVCLRVPYGDAVLLVSCADPVLIGKASALLDPHAVALLSEPVRIS